MGVTAGYGAVLNILFFLMIDGLNLSSWTTVRREILKMHSGKKSVSAPFKDYRGNCKEQWLQEQRVIWQFSSSELFSHESY